MALNLSQDQNTLLAIQLSILSNQIQQYQENEKKLQAQNQKLKEENFALLSKVSESQQKQQDQFNEIQNLTQLVQELNQENQICVDQQKYQNKLLVEENLTLKKALVNLQNNMDLYSNVSNFLESESNLLFIGSGNPFVEDALQNLCQ